MKSSCSRLALHRSCVQEDLRAFNRSKGIAVTAYSPLGSSDSPLLSNPIVNKLAEKYNVGPANILISLQANRDGVAGMYPVWARAPAHHLLTTA